MNGMPLQGRKLIGSQILWKQKSVEQILHAHTSKNQKSLKQILTVC